MTMRDTMTRRTMACCLAGAGAAAIAALWRAARGVDFAGRSILIVGGSRGLGLVIARELASRGARLTLAARDRAELDRAADELSDLGASVHVAACDVRDRHQAEDAVAQAVAAHGRLDMLFNVAGIIQVGPFAHMGEDDFENAMRTHFWGPLHTILAALPHLRQSPVARIVNVSSIGGRIAVPHLLPYSASKFALVGLSKGLNAELAKEGIRVTTVSPGLMRTGSTYNAWFKGDHRREFAWFNLAASLPGLSADARYAARRIVSACARGDAELVITAPARVAILLDAAVPEAFAGLMRLTDRLLPPAVADGDAMYSGWQSVSAGTPSILTRQTERASVENNELPATARS
jgi:NAD(P)-dependent dehydrogenase (short-subunit alcohol dehydrogenase family)